MYRSIYICLSLLVICLTLTHTTAEDKAISPEDLLRDVPEEIPSEHNEGVDKWKSNDDMYINDEEDQAEDDEETTDAADDKVIDKVEEPPKLEEEEEKGSGNITIELRNNFDEDAKVKDEDNKGENIILKYVTDNPDVTVLDLSNKGFSAISATMFQDKLENLKSLDLQKNVLATIDKNAFTSLPRLETVNLSINDLTTLDPDTFSGLPALQELDLSANPLELPSGSLFLNSPTIRRLRMAGCNLNQIPENTFDGMNSLLEIDLGGNPIDEETPITAAVFAALTNLTYVILPESAANTSLAKELCDSHGLLPEVCIESCNETRIPCHPTEEESVDPSMAKKGDEDESKIEPDMSKIQLTKGESNNVELPPSEELPKLPENDLGRRMLDDDVPPAIKSEKSPENKLEDMAEDGVKKAAKSPGPEEETIPESSKSGVTGAGVNRTIIGLLVGGMIAVIAGVLLKKNWSKIRGKKDEPRRSLEGGTPSRTPTERVADRTPESIPLKDYNDKSPPV